MVYVGSTRSRALVERLRGRGWGRLMCRDWVEPYPGEPWALDNGAFGCWKADRDSLGEGRGKMTEQAARIVEQRARIYGDPDEFFERLAMVWSAVLSQAMNREVLVTRREVALCMAALKVLRMAGAPGHEDSVVDCEAYLGFAAQWAND